MLKMQAVTSKLLLSLRISNKGGEIGSYAYYVARKIGEMMEKLKERLRINIEALEKEIEGLPKKGKSENHENPSLFNHLRSREEALKDVLKWMEEV